MDFMAGATIPLHVGDEVELRAGETALDKPYVERLRSFPRLESQGDGMRSFVGLLLHAMLTFHRIILVDEPEAFLHPPQARLLGTLLGREVRSDHQLFLATHSADVLRGLLESESPGLRIIRLRRVGSVNHARELTAADAAEVWRAPVLRYSNILDGVFHEKVVVCEADGDCRFYNAVADALRSPEDHPYVRDVMFTQSGGKGGIAKLVRALRKLDVPVVAVADFDLLRQTGQLRTIVDALGGKVGPFQEDLARLRSEIDSLGTFSASRTKHNIKQLLDEVSDDVEVFPRNIASRISKALKTPAGWQRAAKVGTAILGPGEPYVAAQRLIRGFAQLGLFIVPCGELESFLPDIELEKNEWVHTALERHRDAFDRAPELEGARQFVAQLIAKPA